MAQVNYILKYNLIDPNKAERGTLAVSDGETVEALFKKRLPKSDPKDFKIYSLEKGRIHDLNEPIDTNHVYMITPNMEGLTPFEWIAVFSLVISVGYSVYSYISMKSQLDALKQQDPARTDKTQSQAYTFSDKDNNMLDGSIRAVLCGKTKLGGTIINKLIYTPGESYSERAKMILALGEGPFDEIAPNGEADIFLDDTQLSEYIDYSYDTALGTNSQSALPQADAIYQQHFPNSHLGSTMVMYYSFENNLNNAAHCYKEWNDIVANPSSSSDAGSWGYDSSIKKVGSYSLWIYDVDGRVWWSNDQKNWRDAEQDSFNIQFWLYRTTSDRATGTWAMVQNIPGTTGWGWVFGIDMSTAVVGRLYFNIYYSSGGTPTSKFRIETKEISFSLYDSQWTHVRFCKDGSYYRIFFNLQDMTNRENAYISDEVRISTSSTGSMYIGSASSAAKGRYDGLRIDVGGNVCYASSYTEPTEFTTNAALKEYQFTKTAGRGYADKLIWQIRHDNGLFDASGGSSKIYGSLFYEEVEYNGGANIIYTHGYGPDGAQPISDYARVTKGMCATLYSDSEELPFDYITMTHASGTWELGEAVTGGSSGHVGILFAYETLGSSSYRFYLRDTTGSFSVSETITQDGGASGTVTASLVTANIEIDYFKIKRVVRQRANDIDLKRNHTLHSVTEVRRLELTYPNTALFGIEIGAQKALGDIPRVNVISAKYDTDLYYWDGSLNLFTSSSEGYNVLQNPAWVTWWILSEGFWNNGTQYGRGIGFGIHPRYIDYDSFADWAAYCNAAVSIPGTSLTQKRAEINIIYDEKEKLGWDAVEKACIVGRGRVNIIGNTIYARIDKQQTSEIFVSSGIYDVKTFESEWVEDEDKFDEILIDFLNEDNFYLADQRGYARSDFDTVENVILRSESSFVAGITNAHQARREAIRRVQKSQSLHQRFKFLIDLEAINWEPGDLLRVQHESHRYSYGGIVSSVSGTNIYLGRKVFLDSSIYSGASPRLYFRDNTDDSTVELTITGPFDAWTEYVTVSSVGTIAQGDPFGIGRKTEDFDRMIVEEIVMDSSQKAKVIGFNYDPDVYTHADYGSTEI